MTTTQRGILYGAAAYVLWGIFPLYFPLLLPASPGEILAHRIIWSLVIVGLVLLLLRRFIRMFTLAPRQRLLLGIAAIMLSVNWLTYVYGVLTNQVVETSLGYFINPLVTVALGVFVLGERLNRVQLVAVLLAGVAVALLTWSYGRVPWIALTLAFSFGCYGLLKKKADVPPFESLAFETTVLVLPAAAYVLWLSLSGGSTLATQGWGHALLLVGLGVVTALPLLLFGAAATTIPLVTLGLLQYIAPTLQFLIGVMILDEPMPANRWYGFLLVWVALVIFTADSWRRTRQSTPSPVAEPV